MSDGQRVLIELDVSSSNVSRGTSHCAHRWKSEFRERSASVTSSPTRKMVCNANRNHLAPLQTTTHWPGYRAPTSSTSCPAILCGSCGLCMHEDQQNCFVLECCCPAPPSAANIHAIAWGLLVTLALIVLPSLPFPLLATNFVCFTCVYPPAPPVTHHLF